MRIIAGTAKGRRLVAPPKGRSIRPTTDRVRESLYALVTARRNLQGAQVLDLFAGTGALGCEALSRGAARATFVDRSRAAFKAIRENLQRIGRFPQEIISGAVGPTVRQMRGRFDLILLDPPYQQDLVAPTILLLVDRALLMPGALVAAEHAPNEPLPLEAELVGLEHLTTRTYGNTSVTLWEQPEGDET